MLDPGGVRIIPVPSGRHRTPPSSVPTLATIHGRSADTAMGSGAGDVVPRRDRGTRREQILDGVASAVMTGGSGLVTVTQVANLSGVSRATVYRHFPGGRPELLVAVAREEVEEFARLIDEVLAEAEDIATGLRQAIVVGRRVLAGHRLFQRLIATEPTLLVETVLPQIEVARRRVASTIRGRVHAEHPRREAERLDADATYAASMLLNVIGSAGGWRLDDPDELVELVELYFLAGLRRD